MMEGRTFTKHFHIETRQHEVFDLDLGEGIPRRMLVFGIFVIMIWVALMAPILHTPTATTFSFYVIPPVLFSYFGFQDSERQPRRKNLTRWAIKLRYMTTGHQPIVRLGARSAYRSEQLPMGERVPFEGLVRRLAPWMLTPEWEKSSTHDGRAVIQTGSPIVLGQSATLYGFDHMQKLRKKAK